MHRAGVELGLIGEPKRARTACGLRELPQVDERQTAFVGRVFPNPLTAPGGQSLRQRAVLGCGELREAGLERGTLRPLDAAHRPEQQAVLVLDLHQRHARIARQWHAVVRVLFGEQLLQPRLVGGLQHGVEKQQTESRLIGATGHRPVLRELHGHGPVRRDHAVDALGAHGRHHAPDRIALGAVDVADGCAGRWADLPVLAHQIDAALGQKPRVARQIGRGLRPPRLGHEGSARHIAVDGPKADRLAVAADEVAPCVDAHEAGFTRDALVERAQVEQRVGAELVAWRRERPGGGGIGLGGGAQRGTGHRCGDGQTSKPSCEMLCGGSWQLRHVGDSDRFRRHGEHPKDMKKAPLR